MAIYMAVGIKELDGKVKAICTRCDGGVDHRKLFYKYYRTPERVRKLISRGGTNDALSRYLSRDEVDPSSPFYNEEVTMLPLFIGFPDEKFYMCPSNGTKFYPGDEYNDENDFFTVQKNSEFDDDFVFLFDVQTQRWTVGPKKQDLRDHILERFDNEIPYEYGSKGMAQPDRDKLIKDMDDIDEFIARRNKKPNFVGDEEVLDRINNAPGVLAKYNELERLLESIGVRIQYCAFEPFTKEEEKKI